MSGRLFEFDPQSEKFKSETKTRAITNRTRHTDSPAGCSELHLHQVAGLQVDSRIELHARAAYLRNQSRHNLACGPGDRDEDRGMHLISGVSASAGRVHFESVNEWKHPFQIANSR